MLRVGRLSAVWLLVGGAAFAQSLPVTLLWQAPMNCPQHDEVWARLTERLGHAPTAPQEASFAARGAITKTDEGFKLELQTLNASGAGTRTFTHANCEELTRLAVVALSVAIDPLLEPPPAVTPTNLWLGLGPRLTVAVLPAPSPGLAGSVLLDVRPVSFEFSLETAAGMMAPIPGGRSLLVAFPIGGGLSGCFGYFGARFSAQGCANLRAGLLTGTPSSVTDPIVGLGALLSAGPRVQGRLLVHDRFAIRLSFDGNFTLVAPRFRFADGSFYAPSPFTFAGTLAVDFKLW